MKIALAMVVLVISIGSLITAAYLITKPFDRYDGIPYPHGMMEITKIDCNSTTGQIKATMQNFGYPQTIIGMSVNGKLDKQAIIYPSGIIEHNQTCEITLSEKYAIRPTEVTYKLNTTQSYMGGKLILLGFRMEALSWNESSHKVDVFVSDTSTYFAADNQSVLVKFTLRGR
jgi:hypothetical protein